MKAHIRFSDESLARRAEAWVKSLRSRRVLEQIMEGSFEWPQHFQACQQNSPSMT